MDSLQIFIDFLQTIWKDSTPEDAMHLWKWRVTNYPEVAKKYLDAIAAVVASPPENFVELAKEQGWIILQHEDEQGNIIPYTREEYIAWFEAIHQQFQEVYAALRTGEK